MHSNVLLALALAGAISLPVLLAPRVYAGNSQPGRSAIKKAEQTEKKAEREQRKQDRKTYAVPEPGTMILLGVGIGSLVAGSAWYRRERT